MDEKFKELEKAIAGLFPEPSLLALRTAVLKLRDVLEATHAVPHVAQPNYDEVEVTDG